ncbi:MAG: L-threonylcarbamoyladenylate synthase [Lutimonas sp.]
MNVEIESSLKVLNQGGVLIYPTDTIWGIGCDATSEEAVARVYEIKKRAESKSLVTLVSDWEMLTKYVPVIPGGVSEFLGNATKPTTVIYAKPQGIALNAVSSDNTVAIRVPANQFCVKLIRAFGKPIISTSANYSGSPSPTCFSDIEDGLLAKADYIVNLSRHEIQKSASQIVKFDQDGQVIYIRK